MNCTPEMVGTAFIFGLGLGGIVVEYFSSLELRDLKTKVAHLEHALRLTKSGFGSKLDRAFFYDRED